MHNDNPAPLSPCMRIFLETLSAEVMPLTLLESRMAHPFASAGLQAEPQISVIEPK
jgi:hypothetical protein